MIKRVKLSCGQLAHRSGGKGVGEEPDHPTTKILVPLLIIQLFLDFTIVSLTNYPKMHGIKVVF
jgi:hypothetical protein